MGCLFGYIITFLGASIFDIAGGVPLLPLQTLWVSFATEATQSVGLTYTKPAADVMQRRPRPPSKPILSREQITWLVFLGLIMAIGTLSVVSWAEQAHCAAVAHTMGMVTLAHFNLFFSLELKNDRESVFSLDTFADKTFVITTAVSYVLLVMSTVLGIFHTVLKTTMLDVTQWVICVAVALSIIVVAEIQKAVRRRIATKGARAVLLR